MSERIERTLAYRRNRDSGKIEYWNNPSQGWCVSIYNLIPNYVKHLSFEDTKHEPLCLDDVQARLKEEDDGQDR